MICYKCMNEYFGTVCSHCGFDSNAYEPVPTAMLPMTVLRGRYIIGAVLGKGGFGITYIGYDNLSYRKVAVKEYYPSPIAYRDSQYTSEISVPSNMRAVYENGVKRFYNEAMTLSDLKGTASIVDIYDFFYENNTAYIVMEFIDGVTVEEIVLNQGGLDVDVMLAIYSPIIKALKKVHDKGVLHRDISPSNIMLDDKFASHLIDFGSSRAYSHEMSTDLTVIVKKGFAPVEQYSRKGKHSPAEDVYALCASMYYTLTGKLPPTSQDRLVFDTLQPIHNFINNIPEDIEKVIMKGMSIQPEERYSDMEQLDLAICNAVGEEKTKNENQNNRNTGNSFVGVNDEGKNGDLRINDKQFMPQILCAAAGVLFLILLIILILIL